MEVCLPCCLVAKAEKENEITLDKHEEKEENNVNHRARQPEVKGLYSSNLYEHRKKGGESQKKNVEKV